MVKIALAALLIVASAIVFASDYNIHVRTNGVVLPASCVVDGVRVQYNPASPAFLAKHRAQTALALRDPATGLPAVFYDQRILASHSPELQSFMFAHECAHWALGHMNRPPPHPYHSGAREYEEDAADCWAADRLVQTGFSEEQLNKTLRDIKAEQDQRWLFVSKMPTPKGIVAKPKDGTGRMANARQCMDEAIVKYGKYSNEYR